MKMVLREEYSLDFRFFCFAYIQHGSQPEIPAMRYAQLTLFTLLFFLPSRLVHAATADTTCGIIWDEPILLSDTTSDAYSPRIALSGNDTVHIIWENGPFTIRFPYARSTTAGEVFENVRELLPDSAAFPNNAYWSRVITQDSHVYIFFLYGSLNDTPVRMIQSSDFGSSWSMVRDISPDTAGEIRSASIAGDTIALVYASFATGGYKRILHSSDRGKTWNRTNENLELHARVGVTSGALHLVQHTFGSPADIQYRLSHDLGGSWDQVSILSTIDGFYSDMPEISSSRNSLLLAWRDTKYGRFGLGGASIITRTGMVGDDSVSWEPERTVTDIPRGFIPVPVLTSGRKAVAWIDEMVSNTTFHGVTRFTGDQDSTWCAVTDLTPTTPYTVASIDVALARDAVHLVWEQSVAPDPSTFRIFYQRGRFITTDVDNHFSPLPQTAQLAQNYPNPFNPVTTIGFRIFGREFVSLRVYDMLGREVERLIHEKRDAGEHSIEWNAANLPTGVYYYRLMAGGRIETRKAILIR